MVKGEPGRLHLLDLRSVAQATLDAYAQWLSPGESARLARFVRAERKCQFVAGRALLRLALAPLLSVPASAIELEERPGKAPLLLNPVAVRVGFSIAHSGPWVACMASKGAALGLDIEILDPSRNRDALAQQAFSPHECASLAGRPLRDFYELWSAKEAAIKLGTSPACTHVLRHEALSIVLCSDDPGLPAPNLVLASLPDPAPYPR